MQLRHQGWWLMFSFSEARLEMAPLLRLKSEMNALVRAVMAVDVADYWLAKIRPRHFLPQAAADYQMRPRSPEYNRMKRFGLYGGTVFNYRTGVRVPRPVPPMNLVWTGDLRDFYLSKQPEFFRRRATANSNGSRLTVWLPFGHVVSQDTESDITRINSRDSAELNMVAATALKRRVAMLLLYGTLPASQ